jgi:uncharacterized membrane protein YhaH (DUF805 family)
MSGIGALFLVDRRMSRAGFLFAVPLVVGIAVGCAALVYLGRIEAFLGYLLACWSWLAVHASRCHDTGRSGKPLVFAWPLVIIGALTLGGAIVLVTGAGMPAPASTPTGEEPPIAYAHAGVVTLFAIAGIDLHGVGASTAVLTAAAIPLIVSLLVSIPIGFAPDDPRPNRWGEPVL